MVEVRVVRLQLLRLSEIAEAAAEASALIRISRSWSEAGFAILYLYIGAEWCHCLTKSFCLGLASVSHLCSLIWSACLPRVLLYYLEDMKFRKIHVSHDHHDKQVVKIQVELYQFIILWWHATCRIHLHLFTYSGCRIGHQL